MRIAAVSDLHAGRFDPVAVEALVADLAELAVAAVLVPGDLTQRARRAQFAAARALLDRLGPIALVLPGNHDLPLWDVGRRLLAPRRRYERTVGPVSTEPVLLDGDIAVVGLDTTSRRKTIHGIVAADDRARVAALGALPAALRVVASHHPFVEPTAGAEVVHGAEAVLATCGMAHVDVLLAGHHHVPALGLAALPGRRAVAIHLGTATSTRRRGVPNAYAVLEVDARRERIVVETRSLGRGGFERSELMIADRQPGGWVRSRR